MNNKRLFFYFVSGVLIVATLIGLGVWRFAYAPASFSSHPTKIRVGIIPITDCAQVYVAKHSGIFQRHGLDVELVPMAGGAAILQGLSSGSVDVAFSNLASVVFYEKNAGSLHRLAGGTVMNSQFSEAGLVVRAGSSINDLPDLRGKIIAVNTLRNIVDLAVVRALRLRGVQASDIRLVELPFKDMEAALRSGQIDAAALPEPILSRAMATGGLRSLGDHFILAFREIYATGYFAMPSQVAARKDVFESFDAAMREATPITNIYGPEIIRAISMETKVSEADLQRAKRPDFVESLPDSAIEQMRAWLREEGFLDER